MLERRARWLAICLVCSVIAALFAGFLSFSIHPIVWWFLRKSGSTYLPRGAFELQYHAVLLGVEGFLLGLVPLHRLRAAGAALLARFRFAETALPESTWNRPLLWAWLPFALLLLWRMLVFDTGESSSVLGRTSFRETRWEHLFGPLTFQRTLPEYLSVLIDRFVVLGPMILLLAYTLAVWLRHALPPTSIQYPRDGRTAE